MYLSIASLIWIDLSRITLQWANIKKAQGSGGQFHTNHCILSNRASSWFFCLQEYGKGLRNEPFIIYYPLIELQKVISLTTKFLSK